MSGEHYLHGWRRLRGWERILATNITDLLDWQSDISQQYPHLHNAFLDRFEDFMSKRYDEDRVSMCNHDFSGLSSMLHRADSYSFQKTDNHNNDPTIDNNQIYDQLWRYNNVCPSLLRRLEFYGIIGSGSKSLFLPSFNPAYGTVVLARERSPASHRGRFYAVKIEPHYTMENRARRGYAPAMTAIHDVDNEYYFISLEALLLLLTGASDRFMNLDSVYVENRLHMTVMSACVDYDIQHQLDLNEGVPSFQGRYLWNNKKPILDELGGCKVSSQLLEAFAYLWDMNITHSDLSEMNFLVDENLNACLIDLGMTTFGFERQDFCNHFWAIIGSIERMITPELALELFKPYWKDKELHPSRHQVNILIPYDATIDDGWKLACIIYQIMHGFAAWESPESKNQVDNPMHGIDMLGYGNMSDENGAYETMIYERRDRVINEELPIDENLSQDCADALRIMLQKKPLDRPSFTERYSFPWFNQWASYQDQVFLRPYSESYEDSRMHRGVLSCPSYGPLEP